MKKKKKSVQCAQQLELVPKEDLENLPAELVAEYEQDAVENMEHVHDAFYRIGITGGRFRVDNQLVGDQGVEFEAIILKEMPVNIWYSTVYDSSNPSAPDCWSLGGLKPDPSCVARQSESCITCKMNKFGSAVGKDGKRRSKACHNTRRIILKIQSVDLPVIMSLPPTSIKLLNNYLKELSRGEVALPMFALTTRFTFDTTVEYPRPCMNKGKFLDVKEYRAIKEYRNSDIVTGAMTAYASTADYEAGSLEEEDDKKPF
ncbi:MAG: hypothetical protein ABIG95_02605 [Candidatus Woesearchaeota archaeon]